MRLRRTIETARLRPAAQSDHSALSSLRSLRLATPDQTQIALLGYFKISNFVYKNDRVFIDSS
jgi:hypothetical protein